MRPWGQSGTSQLCRRTESKSMSASSFKLCLSSIATRECRCHKLALVAAASNLGRGGFFSNNTNHFRSAFSFCLVQADPSPLTAQSRRLLKSPWTFMSRHRQECLAAWRLQP